MSHPEVFQRALRAAAAVTGIMKHGAVVGLTAGTLVLAGGCSPAQPPSRPVVQNGGGATAPSEPDASLPVRDCKDDPGYNSACCTAARKVRGRIPEACQAWGPPAPPEYRGERIVRGAEQAA